MIIASLRAFEQRIVESEVHRGRKCEVEKSHALIVGRNHIPAKEGRMVSEFRK